MANNTQKTPYPVIAVDGQLFDLLSSPPDLTKFRIALRSWFMSYLTQTDDHVNRSPLSENIYYYEVRQEWLDTPNMATVFSTSSNA